MGARVIKNKQIEQEYSIRAIGILLNKNGVSKN
jgi:hypothetical protein